MKSLILWSVCVLAVSTVTVAQTNPVPLLNNPLAPASAAPGGGQFTLTVNGTGFVSGAVVNWNDTGLATNFVSSSQLTATVPAAKIAVAGTGSVTVVNPSPGGGESNVDFFEVRQPFSAVEFDRRVLSLETALASPGIPRGNVHVTELRKMIDQVREEYSYPGKPQLKSLNSLRALASEALQDTYFSQSFLSEYLIFHRVLMAAAVLLIASGISWFYLRPWLSTKRAG